MKEHVTGSWLWVDFFDWRAAWDSNPFSYLAGINKIFVYNISKMFAICVTLIAQTIQLCNSFILSLF